MPRRRRVPLEQVEVEFILLADSAQAVLQKLYVLGGGWNQITAPKYPTNHPMGIATGVIVPWNLCNQKHELALEITTEDGGVLLPQQKFAFKAGRPAHLKEGSSQRVVFAINGLFGIPREGRYVVRASVGTSERTVSFDAVEGIVVG